MAEPRVSELASQLYDACSNLYDTDYMISQKDLQALGIIPTNDLDLLLQCTQHLVNQKLFRLLEGQGKTVSWGLVSRGDAEKLKDLNKEEAMVYGVIHSTARQGIWVRAIQTRSGLHKSILDRCLKLLESRNYIKTVHNVKFPNRKIYMIAGLAPSEEITGGAWFTDGVLDASFINGLASFIEYTVSKHSWYLVPTENRGRTKRMKMDSGVGQDTGEKKKTYLPYPADYKGYPTVDLITTAINASGVTPVRLEQGKVTQLLRMLCYDKKVVALPNGFTYKSLKDPGFIQAQQAKKPAEGEPPVTNSRSLGINGMIESPCGNCPSFSLCKPGTAVSPETCEYYDPWIEKVLGF
ncbi:hypothetical protein N7495_007293 [Penicillium taxi]|uniref:uncharacterized protein n=1 Tax=Penicillium taxi TaxID=168475 RepID=UPI0025459FBB|nr:uncharacterized protein N7495_007293 [Penicillium taxi]KAJ5895602.1 hypothetical protein N7495_007293 [Penicillium taxi]